MVTLNETKKSRPGGRRNRHQVRNEAAADRSISNDLDVKIPYAPLSQADVLKVHRTALQLLEEVGMGAPTKNILDVALPNGCWLNEHGRLCYPKALVEDLLAKAARSFVVHGRDSSFDFEAANGKMNLCTGGAAVKMLDRKTRQYRDSTLPDLFDLARIADQMRNIQWFARPVVATEIPDLFNLDANTIYACAAGTRKHIATSIIYGEHVQKLLPLLDAIGGGEGKFRKRPFCTVHATTVVSPMNFAEDSVDVALEAIKIGMPIHCQTGPQAGATAPAALAGTLAQICAEGLASLCLINMVSPGYPVVLGNWAFVSDLRTGAFSGGGGEQALLGAASGQMSAFYGIPGGMGAGMTDSKLPDNQSGYEKGMTMTLATLSGGGFVFESAGMLASLLGCSLEAMVIDDDMLSCIRRIGRGIEVNDETLSFDVIKETVTGPGHFLGSTQTMALMESEFVYPINADRKSPDDWRDAGSKDMWEKASERVDEILGGPFENQIEAGADRWIRDNFDISLKLTAQQGVA